MMMMMITDSNSNIFRVAFDYLFKLEKISHMNHLVRINLNTQLQIINFSSIKEFSSHHINPYDLFIGYWGIEDVQVLCEFLLEETILS